MITVPVSGFKLDPANARSQQDLFLAKEEKGVLSRHITHTVHFRRAQHILSYSFGIITKCEKRFDGGGQRLTIHAKIREVKS